MEREQLDTVVSGQHQRERKRSRDKRVKICNHLFRPYGLSLREWNHKYIIQNNKGKMNVVYDLGQIWQSAEDLLGKSIDPLDPVLLQRLKP